MAKKQRKGDIINVKSIAGTTPSKMFDEMEKSKGEYKIVKKPTGDEVIKIKKEKLLKRFKKLLFKSINNLLRKSWFLFSQKILPVLKEVIEIPAYIVLNGIIAEFVLITILSIYNPEAYIIGWESIIHIIGLGSLWYLLYDFIKMVKGTK